MKKSFDPNEQLFLPNKEKWIEHGNKEVIFEKRLTVQEIENGVILPLRKVKKTKINQFEGGVTDKEGNFVAGHIRSLDDKDIGKSCKISYTPDTFVPHRKETVVFGGVVRGHYGHLLAENLGRMWWYAENSETPYKFIFLLMAVQKNETFTLFDIFEAAGLSKDRYEFIETPTSFDKIIIPEQACIHHLGYFSGYEKFYDHIISNVSKKLQPSPHKKIYFSRAILDGSLGVNEKYYEEFYKKRGFHIVYPETLSFSEKVALVQGAEEFVSIFQSGIYTLLCANPNLKVTILVQEGISHISHWFAFSMRNLAYTFVHANLNFLPSKHEGNNCYFYGPNRYWNEFLKKKEILHTEEEISTELHVNPYVYEYIEKWCQHYSNPRYYSNISNYSLIDILLRNQNIFDQKTLDRKLYAEPNKIQKLQGEVKELKNKNKILSEQVNTLQKLIFDSLNGTGI